MPNADSPMVGVAIVVACLMFILYLLAGLKERGRDPFYDREVYLFYPSGPRLDPAGVAAACRRFGATVATPAQVAVYAAHGGDAHGYGLTADARFMGLTPASGPGGAATRLAATAWPGAAPPTSAGVWLLGPKPRRGTPGVVPFSLECPHEGHSHCWFHPAARVEGGV
jgi:hypothetical protein